MYSLGGHMIRIYLSILIALIGLILLIKTVYDAIKKEKFNGNIFSISLLLICIPYINILQIII